MNDAELKVRILAIFEDGVDSLQFFTAFEALVYNKKILIPGRLLFEAEKKNALDR